MTDKGQFMTKVIERYCADFPNQLSNLIAEIEKTARTPADEEMTLRLTGEIHRMGGTAHCMGFKFLGLAFEDLNKDLYRYQEAGKANSPEALQHVADTLKHIARYQPDVVPRNSKLLQRATALDDLITAESRCDDLNSGYTAKRRVIARERVLFADDDPHVRDLMERTLKNLGVEHVHIAASGNEVISALESFEPTMIITDWMMEPVDGLTLLKKIRSGDTNLEADTPVIFFTSLKSRANKLEATKNGANKVLSKPVVPAVISKTVLSIAEKQFRNRKNAPAHN